MGINYNLYLLPKDRSFRPEAEALRSLLGWLPTRLGVADRWYPDSASRSTSKQTPVNGDEMLRRLVSVVEAGKGSGEALIELPMRVSTALFGWNGEDEDPDDHLWADTLGLGVSAWPTPFIDWNGEDDPPSFRCPDCGARVDDEVHDAGTGDGGGQEGIVKCVCGTTTPLQQVEATGRVRFARLWIALTGNKGWHREVEDDAEAFADRAFLEEFARLAGTPIEVFCEVC